MTVSDCGLKSGSIPKNQIGPRGLKAEFSARMQKLYCSPRTDKRPAQVGSGQNVSGKGLVTGIVEPLPDNRSKTAFTQISCDGFNNDSLDLVGHEPNIRPQQIPVSPGHVQGAGYDASGGNRIKYFNGLL